MKQPAFGGKFQMMRRILCLYLPNWPIQRLLAARKKGEGRRTKGESKSFVISTSSFVLILHARDPRRGDLVAAANDTAHERGVRLGMPLAEAAALIDKYEGQRTKDETQNKIGHQLRPLILPHDPAADLAALARLAEHCERFSPIVGWDTVQGSKFQVQGSKPKDQTSLALNLELGTLNFCGPDSLFLDVTGIGVLFGGEENLAREAISDAASLGYETRVAIADTIGAASALARQDGSKFRVQGSRFCFQDDTTLNFELGTLNLGFLRLPSETIDLLVQLGITRLEQLLVLPRESLRARFGERLLLRIDQLLGSAQETIAPYRPPPQFANEWLFEYPAERRDVIEQVLHELVRRVAHDLANRREGVLKLSCRLDCAPGRPVFLEIGLFRPSADASHLWDLVRMQLEQNTLSGPVGRLRLEATLTAPLENRQGELFTGNAHEAARQLALLIDRCSSRLGREAVLCPELTADPLPERAVRFRAGVRSQESGVRGFKIQGSKFKVRRKRSKTLNFEPGTLNSTLHSALLRPLSLFLPPLEVAAVSIAPDGPLVSFQLQGVRYEIAHHCDPERIEAGWWRGKSVRRDYWRVETTTGRRFWLFRNLDNGQWHLHGEF